MNLEKFTERAKGFLQAAQTVAIGMNHQRIGPEHLLKALLEDDQGMASGLIREGGGNVEAAVRATDAALAKIPQVSGGRATQPPGTDNASVRVLYSAEKNATQSGTSNATSYRWRLSLCIPRNTSVTSAYSCTE